MLCCSKTSIPGHEITNIWKANVLNDLRRVKSTLTVLASPVLDAEKLLTPIIRAARQTIVNTSAKN